MAKLTLKNSVIKDVEVELQAITASFKTVNQVRDDIQAVLVRCAVTAHVHGDIRAVNRIVEYIRTEAPAGLNLNRMAEWIGRNLPAHYSTAKLVWVFNSKKRLELDDAQVQDMFLDKWYADSNGSTKAGFKPIDAVARLKSQAKAWAKAINDQGDAAGVNNAQLNALLECIRNLEAL